MGELVAAAVAEPDTLVVAAHLAGAGGPGRHFCALLAEHMTEHHLDALRKKNSEVRRFPTLPLTLPPHVPRLPCTRAHPCQRTTQQTNATNSAAAPRKEHKTS